VVSGRKCVSELDLGRDSATGKTCPVQTPSVSDCQEGLREVLAQDTKSCERNQLGRITQLEQALEESLILLAQLKLQLKDQHLLETQLVATEETANLQKHAINELQRQLVALNLNLMTAQVKMEALETQVAGQHQANAQLQLSIQEIQTDRDRYLSRLLQLEQENSLLPEKLLQQVKQVNEHEVAVQFWKELYYDCQHHLLELKVFLERTIPAPATELTDLLKGIEPPPKIDAINSVANKALTLPCRRKQSLSVDLPAFLTRYRRSTSVS